ncbi:hypothetical protein P7H16_02285 [Paenibacillus larvae]|nr:hypothetical protein [Paenibacillus larvae]MDT2239431.1 hypothetical protein [Paenibacillus larvae]MDT2246077.1 hypothetical protein [Paenibacillus larvae]
MISNPRKAKTLVFKAIIMGRHPSLKTGSRYKTLLSFKGINSNMGIKRVKKKTNTA